MSRTVSAKAVSLPSSHTSQKILLAVAAALALMAAIPSISHASPAGAVSTRHADAQATPTDISAAKRRHPHVVARGYRDRDSVRGAYGAYVEQPDVVAPSYGYGYGDNSRNQTW